MFKLWEKNQLLVIISRVKELKNITFVGPKSLTLKTLREITFNKTQWDYFIDRFTENLTISGQIQPLTNYPAAHHVYAISRQAIPDDHCASVYCLFSLKDGSLETGSTMSVKKIVQDVNTFCSDHKLMSRKPWALLCAVFNPAADAIDSGVVSMLSSWANVVDNSRTLRPCEVANRLEEQTKLQSNFFESLNFVSFIEQSN